MSVFTVRSEFSPYIKFRFGTISWRSDFDIRLASVRFVVDKAVLEQILFIHEALDFALSASFHECFTQKSNYIKSAQIIVNKSKEP